MSQHVVSTEHIELTADDATTITTQAAPPTADATTQSRNRFGAFKSGGKRFLANVSTKLRSKLATVDVDARGNERTALYSELARSVHVVG